MCAGMVLGHAELTFDRVPNTCVLVDSIASLSSHVMLGVCCIDLASDAWLVECGVDCVLSCCFG